MPRFEYKMARATVYHYDLPVTVPFGLLEIILVEMLIFKRQTAILVFLRVVNSANKEIAILKLAEVAETRLEHAILPLAVHVCTNVFLKLFWMQ